MCILEGVGVHCVLGIYKHFFYFVVSFFIFFYLFVFGVGMWVLLVRNEQVYVRRSWVDELDEIINRCKGSSLAARVGRLALSVTVY